LLSGYHASSPSDIVENENLGGYGASSDQLKGLFFD
jgi:hypothetical protein